MQSRTEMYEREGGLHVHRVGCGERRVGIGDPGPTRRRRPKMIGRGPSQQRKVEDREGGQKDHREERGTTWLLEQKSKINIKGSKETVIFFLFINTSLRYEGEV